MVIMSIDPLTVSNVFKGGDFTKIPLVLQEFAIEFDEVLPVAPPWKRNPFHDANTSLFTMIK